MMNRKKAHTRALIFGGLIMLFLMRAVLPVLSGDAWAAKQRQESGKDDKTASKSAAPEKKARQTVLRSIKHWSNSDYTRVVIETEGPVEYTENMLNTDPEQPPRLYLDFANCRIAPNLKEPIPIQDGLLKRVRAAQFNPQTVRVVVDLESFSRHKVFSLQNPFKVIIDVMGDGKGGGAAKATQPNPQKSIPPTPKPVERRIVIDAGHGGKDPGAIGKSGLYEKDVVLSVAKMTAEILKKQPACKVILTRKDDRFLALEERTAIANTEKADLFVSIHANAAPQPGSRGIETYFLDLTTNEDSMRVAARENATNAPSMSNLQMILNDLVRNNKLNESAKLADLVQASMVEGMAKKYSEVNNLGVKQAPFYVLIGAQMPAILTEISFLSNPVEEERLKRRDYLEALANNISAGVKSYVTQNHLAARDRQ